MDVLFSRQDVHRISIEHPCVIRDVFNGEFMVSSKRASIAFRNYELYRYIDLRKWYVSCVVESILALLEEFQERDSRWALSRILNDEREQTQSFARDVITNYREKLC